MDIRDERMESLGMRIVKKEKVSWRVEKTTRMFFTKWKLECVAKTTQLHFVIRKENGKAS